MFGRLKLKLFATELLLYLVTIFFALLVGERLKLFAPSAVEAAEFTLGQFLLYFFLATGVFLFSIRLFKKGTVWQFVFALAIFAGAQVVFSLVLPEVWAAVFAILLVTVRFLSPTVFWQNAAVMLSIAGISAVFGLSLNPYSVVVILIVLSVYDYIAVYATRHMVKLAETMIHYQAILAFVIPERVSGWLDTLDQAQPGRGFMVLGGGDVALPLVMIISTSLISLRHAFLVAFFVLLGVFFTHLLFFGQKARAPIPALPPIALFAIVGFLISLFLF